MISIDFLSLSAIHNSQHSTNKKVIWTEEYTYRGIEKKICWHISPSIWPNILRSKREIKYFNHWSIIKECFFLNKCKWNVQIILNINISPEISGRANNSWKIIGLPQKIITSLVHRLLHKICTYVVYTFEPYQSVFYLY